jgi:amino acid adenylation domain-containing protein
MSDEAFVFPVSFAQQRLWLLDQLEPGNPAYIIAAGLRLGGRLDVAALRRSFRAIIRRHEALHTTISVVDGALAQIVRPSLDVPLIQIDLQSCRPSQRERVVQRLAQAAQRPFDLATGPLVRTVLLRTDEAEHVLLLVVHHIVADEWSIAIFVQELVALYSGYTTGEPARLPELPIQYADFAHWQREWLQGELLKTQLDYWQRQLRGVLSLDLPADHARPAAQTFRGARQPVAISRHVAELLKRLGRREEATLFMAVLAAFKLLLARYAGQTDIVLGTPIANRNEVAIEGLIGFFVNTLVLRTDLAGNPTYREALRRVRAVCLAAYANQDVPFERLVELLQPERSMSHTPLFQVMFVLQRSPLRTMQLPGLTLTTLEIDSATAKFDLMLALTEDEDGAHGWLEYSTDLFDAPRITRLIGHFQTLLAGIVADPEQPLADLPLLTAQEQRQIVAEWNDTLAGRPPAPCLHALFEAQAARTPEAVALVAAEQHFSYATLDQRANQLARHLRARGVTRDAPVGICLERSPELVISVLGVLKAGGAYLPLDPSYPAERLAFMLADSQARVLIVATQGAGPRTKGAGRVQPLVFRLSSFVGQVVDLRADWPLIARESTANPAGGARGSELAYVLYTSGSTGQPKGVAMPHAPLVNLIAWQLAYSGPAVPRTVQFAALSFDVACQEFFSTWAAGGTLVVIDEQLRRDATALLALLDREAITQVFLPFVALQHLSEIAATSGVALRALREVITAGEQLQVTPALRDWLRACGEGRVRVQHQYGPTESHVVIAWPLTGKPAAWPARPPIGRPITNTQAYVLDRRMQPVAIGVVGELYLGGAGLARGYLHRPALTAERFVPNPFVTTDDERRRTNDERAERLVVLRPASCVRLYRTGDLARWRADGALDFVGRRDQQVKLRGFRVELEEIEALLGAHPAVRAAAVAMRADAISTNGYVDQRLVAYVVMTNDERRTTNDAEHDSSVVLRPSSAIPELRAFLQSRLPDYMLPATFVLLDALPLTPSGKLDRRALPTHDRDRAAQEQPFVAPRTLIETVIAQSWSAVLGVESGIHDNFFALGGHSLLAAQLAARLRDTLQVELPLRTIFEMPTIAALAAEIEAMRWSVRELHALALRPVTREGALPATPTQRQMWFFDQLAPDRALYTLPIAVHLNGPLDVAALKHGLTTIIQRHEALRTVFALVETELRQIIRPALAPALPLIELAGLPAPRRMITAERLLTTAVRRAFDLADGPLLHTLLLRLDAEKHILLLNIHHMVADGWSIGVFVRELAALYSAQLARQLAALPELPIQYADYAAWQRTWLQGAPREALLDYWRRSLDGCPSVLTLPTDRPRPAVQTFRGAAHAFAISADLTAALMALRRENVTLFMTLLAAFQTLLYRYSGQAELLIGTPVANRQRTEIEPLIGCFANTLVLRADLSGTPSVATLLARVRAATLGAYAHQELPFEQLVAELQPERDVSRTPLFQVAFALQNAPLPPLALPGLILTAHEVATGTAKFELALAISEADHALAGVFEYNTDLFDPTTIARMAQHFLLLLHEISANLRQPLAALPMLTAAEQQQLLVEWRGFAAADPQDVCIDQLFAAQAARTPDAVAVVFHEPNDERRTTNDELSGFVFRPSSFVVHLTYAELNRRANQLAHVLRARGVGPGVRVGIAMGRTPELVVALLAVFKSGGAYVPLDPAYPAERLAFMCDDAQVAVLLTVTMDDGRVQPIVFHPSSFGGQVVDLRADWPLIAGESTANPARGATGNDLAYVIYTSGSTGRPKGVMIEHRQLVNTLKAAQAMFQLTANERVPAIASFAFDIALFELFGPLLVGGATVLLTRQQVLDLPQFAATLCEITFIHSLPSLMRQIVDFVRAEGRPSRYRKLRGVFIGGDLIPIELVRDIRALFGAQLYLGYGPTEGTIMCTNYIVRAAHAANRHVVGRPMRNMRVQLYDAQRNLVPIGVPGEVFIGGAGVARGYLGRPDLTAEQFVPDPFATAHDERRTTTDEDSDRAFVLRPSSFVRLYKTGDLARWLPDGMLEFLGRIDAQVKVRGFRIELGEIEMVLSRHPAVREAVVLARADSSGEQRLVAYVVPTRDDGRKTQDESAPSSSVRRPSSLVSELRAFLAERLPDYMIPAAFVLLDTMPVTHNGKVDLRALPDPQTTAERVYAPPTTALERAIAEIWQAVLQVERVGIHDHFFELGGHSLLMVRVHGQLRDLLKRDLAIVDLFQYPTIHALAQHLGGEQAQWSMQTFRERAARQPTNDARHTNHAAPDQPLFEPIAIIGMAGRFPGAADLEQFWRNLRDGVESISFFSDDELAEAGIAPALLSDPSYIKAAGLLDDVDLFDAAFFGLTPREAELTDPQQRLFLECAWTALEHAGYTPDHAEPIGVFAGAGWSQYLLFHLLGNHDQIDQIGLFQAQIGNGADFVATRVSYKLNLKGPGLTVQTACSTSLVAAHLACQSLAQGQCDLALAGGVALNALQKSGYHYYAGGVNSPDGHCRTFDAGGQGTVPSSGVGVVVLKRLRDALADGDTIHAVIKGAAINNDGALKVGYTAPSVDGQAQVIALAQTLAGVDPASIGYIEAHGTATPLGDPIEIAALTQVFRAGDAGVTRCAIGALKSNIGHTDAAAGIAGLLKTTLALEHGQIPPSLHFQTPNPAIDFASTPFYVNTQLIDWPERATPRRAGVSAFGIGGTNVHMVLEAAPARAAAQPSRPWQLLVLSAKTASALDTATANLANHLRRHPELHLADVAYTLQVGRSAFAQRRAFVCRDHAGALAALDAPQPAFSAAQTARLIVFMFPGGGAQHVAMALELYQGEPIFRAVVDQCAELLQPQLGCDLRAVLYPATQDDGRRTQDETDSSSEGSPALTQTGLALPALFVVEYALAQLWMAWGVRPSALIGHSLGEYVAACLAGTFALDDALALVALRGRLMETLPSGAMLSVALPEAELRPLLGQQLALAAINAPALCVVSGDIQAIDALGRTLAAQGVRCQRILIDVAAHSPIVAPILDEFRQFVATLDLHAPQIPFISNVSGTWISPAEATDPGYWARHLRQTVRFADGLGELLRDPDCILLEVGPGRTLTTLAKRQTAPATTVLASLRHPDDQQPDGACLLNGLGQLWLAGVPIDWARFAAHEQRQRLPLPTYPFERESYWIERPREQAAQSRRHSGRKDPDQAAWFYAPFWKPATPPPADYAALARQPQRWLVFCDECGLGAQVVERLRQAGQSVVEVAHGEAFGVRGVSSYALDLGQPADYAQLIGQLQAQGWSPQQIVHLWSVGGAAHGSAAQRFGRAQDRGFYSLLFLAQALDIHAIAGPLRIAVVANGMQAVYGEAAACPEKATVLGPCNVIPQEFPQFLCCSIDIAGAQLDAGAAPGLADRVIAEISAPAPEIVVAYRRRQRLVRRFEPLRCDAQDGTRLRAGGVYLITGGLGRIGLVLAAELARAAHAKIVLVGHSTFPERDEWEGWLNGPDAEASVSQRIRQVRAIEQLGGEVLLIRADVADVQQMRAAIAQTITRFGALHGVIHAAVFGGEQSLSPIRELRRDDCERQFRPKVFGMFALAQALEGRPLDFCMLCSSLSALLGGIRMAAYAAANLCLDAFAQTYQQTSEQPWISVNWEGWQFDAAAEHAVGAGVVEQAITPTEGQSVFYRLLSADLGAQIAISTSDLPARIDYWLRREADAGRVRGRQTFHTRPQLQVERAAPRNDVEYVVAGIWQELLGIADLGIHDNFFQLGGDSLLGTELVSRLRQVFQVDLPLKTFFHASTVADVSQALLGCEAQPGQLEQIAQIWRQIEGMDAEEVWASVGRIQE